MVKIEDLLKKLIRLNIHPKFYSIGFDIKENAYNIERMFNGEYALFYLERGERINERVFKTEEEALLHLISSLEKNLKYGLDLSN
ncbi:hypothetical protein ACI6PS_07935 [Flavobacterium sp. PLA-1-15]|uniref:hypothetical protein n=1 Tax=Flavobacterium sp. PLA-1-15 TaxID=3380533 RepID=UPI003B81B4A4